MLLLHYYLIVKIFVIILFAISLLIPGNIKFFQDFKNSKNFSRIYNFPNIRRIGCFFHYSYNLRKKLIECNIIKIANNKIGEGLLKDLLSIPFKIRSN